MHAKNHLSLRVPSMLSTRVWCSCVYVYVWVGVVSDYPDREVKTCDVWMTAPLIMCAMLCVFIGIGVNCRFSG